MNMKNLVKLLILMVCLNGCGTFEQYESVSVWVGVQVPIPMYEINVGFKMDLKGKASVEEELRTKNAFLDAYGDFLAWKKQGAIDALSNE